MAALWLIIPTFKSVDSLHINIIEEMHRCETVGHLLEARDYILSIGKHGLDVSALYIAQAYLTKVQASLRPTHVLAALFKEEDLLALAELCGSGTPVAQRGGAYNEPIISEPLLKYFKLAALRQDHPYEHTNSEAAHLLSRILDSLEEWEVITARASRLAARLEGQRRQERDQMEVKRIEDSLDAFLGKILHVQQNTTEFTTLESFNQTCSIGLEQSEDSPSEPEDEVDLSEQGVGVFLGYVSMWMGQTLQEIAELKSILDVARSESSLDHEPRQKKAKVSKSSLLTSKIRQGHLDVPRIDGNFFDENQRPSGLKSEMNFTSRQRQERGSQVHRVTLGTLSSNKELRPRRSSDNCTSCELY